MSRVFSEDPAGAPADAQTGPRPRTTLLHYATFVAAIATLAGVVWFVASDFAAKVESLAKARSDNVQWSLSQVEVEYLIFDQALRDVGVVGAEALPQLRQHFDILYSRIDTLRSSDLFREVREQDDFQPALAETWTTITDALSYIDGPDQMLLDNLDTLIARFDAIHDDVRMLGLHGISFFAERSDERREGIAETLNRVAAITLILVFILTLMIFVLWRFSRVLRSHAEDARLSADRMSAVVTTALDAVVVSDHSGVIHEFNGGAEDIFGYTRDEVLGRTIEDILVPPHLRTAHIEGFRRYLSTGERRVIGQGRVKLEARRKNGSTFPVELSLSSTRQQDGAEIFVAFLRDITSRVATEQALRQARDTAMAGERAKAELLAVMSHEMRTPLNGMLGTLELLGETDLSARQQKYLSVANRSGQLLLHHVNDVLDVARLESGKMGIEQRVVDLSDLVREVVEGQQTVAEAGGNAIEVSLPPADKSLVLSDPVRLRQILLNLVGNAVKFTRNGVIHISVDRLGYDDMVEISVTDTGIGIAPEDIERVFSDFVTLDATYDRKNTGTGLGLAIARRMARAMNGDIGVESEPGEGSLFWIRIPMPPAPADATADEDIPAPVVPLLPEVTTPAQPDHAPLRVLVVEDNEINRLVVREMLETAGHTVTEAMDGLEGADAARDHKFDLILMDISMPHMDGIEATRLIRSRDGASSGVPIVALTAHAMLEEISRFKAAGMDHSLTKPISRESLQIALNLARGTPASPDMPEKSAPEADTPVDQSRLDTMAQEVGAERLGKLIDAFLAEADKAVDCLTTTQGSARDDRSVLATLHHLAGSAAVFGARDLHGWLAEMERLGKSGKTGRMHDRLPEIGPIWARTRAQFAEIQTAANPD